MDGTGSGSYPIACSGNGGFDLYVLLPEVEVINTYVS